MPPRNGGSLKTKPLDPCFRRDGEPGKVLDRLPGVSAARSPDLVTGVLMDFNDRVSPAGNVQDENRIVAVVPCPGVLCNVTGQSKRSPSRRTIDRPTPMPPG